MDYIDFRLETVVAGVPKFYIFHLSLFISDDPEQLGLFRFHLFGGFGLEREAEKRFGV